MTKRHVTGSIRPRPSKDNIKYYDVVLELGKNPLTGKRERVSFRIDTTDREEAENFLTMKKAEYLTGNMLMPCDKTVGVFLDEYLRDYVYVQCSPATYRDYKTNIDRYLKPLFGKIKLQNLQSARIQQVYNQLRTKSNASDRPLRVESIKHINRIFKAALTVACKLEYIKKNPTHDVKIGKDSVNDKLEVYTTEEIIKLKKAVKGTDMEVPIALLFDCVMRRGELLGLKFKDIDFDKKSITIQREWIESIDCKEPVLKDCKTSSSFRKMIVSDETIKLLKRQEIRCKQICLREGKRFSGEHIVVCKADGEPYRPKSFTRKWAETLKKYGLRHIKLHGTRHSAISWLLSQGVPLHIVQKRAGHQNPNITLSVYSHVAKDDENIVADLLDSKLFAKVAE